MAQWLDQERADPELRATAAGLRGFFLADPEELSLLALVDQFAGSEEAGANSPPGAPAPMFRIAGGNDRLPSALAARLGGRIQLGTELVAVSVRGKSVHSVLKHGRTSAPLTSDYLVLALPASVLRRVPITPALPAHQHEAIANSKYGRATKTRLHFSSASGGRPGARASARRCPMARSGKAMRNRRADPAF